MVIPQDAEVSKVAVLIVDQGVKHQHTADLLGKLRPQLVVVGKAGGNAPGSDNAPDGDIGCVDVGKQGTLRGGNAFPVLQVIMHGVQAHGSRNLRSIILAVRLPARIGRAGRAALVEINPIVLYIAPRLGQHTACGQLRGCGKRLPAPACAGIGHQRQYLGKAIFVKIVLGELPLKSLRHHPIAVVERQPLAHVDDSLGVVMAEAKGFQNLVHKGAVFGDNPPLQPMNDALAGALHIQRQQMGLLLVGV